MRNRASALRLVGRVYLPRVVGLGFAFLAVAYFLYRSNAHPLLWSLLVAWGLIWPHVAHLWPRYVAHPMRAEIINLYVDAFMIGFWVPLMSFNPIPSIAMLYMHMLSVMSVLGFRACMLCLLVELVGMAVTVALFGFAFNPQLELIPLLISLPMLVVYPLFVGFNAYWLSVKLANKQAAFKKLSERDGLTGLYNRLHWEEEVAREFARVRRGGGTASLIFIDVDWFKQINDRHGHLAGDEVLRVISAVLQESARSIDICGRYGGEEFGVLMPDTKLSEAHTAAERLRSIIGSRSLHPELDVRTTISVGVAEISPEDQSYSEWLDRTDHALYAAKQQGRNVTVGA